MCSLVTALTEQLQGNEDATKLLEQALSALPEDQRSKVGNDLQQLLSSGMLAAAIAAAGSAGGTGDMGGGGEDEPYDPENPL